MCGNNNTTLSISFDLCLNCILLKRWIQALRIQYSIDEQRSFFLASQEIFPNWISVLVDSELHNENLLSHFVRFVHFAFCLVLFSILDLNRCWCQVRFFISFGHLYLTSCEGWNLLHVHCQLDFARWAFYDKVAIEYLYTVLWQPFLHILEEACENNFLWLWIILWCLHTYQFSFQYL